MRPTFGNVSDDEIENILQTNYHIPLYRNDPAFIELWARYYDIHRDKNILLFMMLHKISRYHHFLYVELAKIFPKDAAHALLRKAIKSNVQDRGALLECFESLGKMSLAPKKSEVMKMLRPASVILWGREWAFGRSKAIYPRDLLFRTGGEISFEEYKTGASSSPLLGKAATPSERSRGDRPVSPGCEEAERRSSDGEGSWEPSERWRKRDAGCARADEVASDASVPAGIEIFERNFIGERFVGHTFLVDGEAFLIRKRISDDRAVICAPNGDSYILTVGLDVERDPDRYVVFSRGRIAILKNFEYGTLHEAARVLNSMSNASLRDKAFALFMDEMNELNVKAVRADYIYLDEDLRLVPLTSRDAERRLPDADHTGSFKVTPLSLIMGAHMSDDELCTVKRLILKGKSEMP